MSDVIRVSVPGPKDLSLEDQEILLRHCAEDLLDLGIPFDSLKLTSDDLELIIDGSA